LPPTSEPPADDGAAAFAGNIQSPPRARPRIARATIAGLAIAIALIAGAWYLGGRQDVNRIGQSGTRPVLPRIGEAAPDFVALDRNDEPVTLSQFRGQPVWLNFWGSWCPPCRAEMPAMEAAYARLQPRGLVMLAVALDESVADAVRYADKHGATYTIAADPFRRGTETYTIANFPTHILIDGDGIVRDVVLAELNEEQFIARAAAILSPDGSV
jgi:cytochrome c biogenesis protein CcmG, thiol:disulfide interchange protein DsbE